MDEIRINRIRAMMKDELSVMINREMKDPKVPFVTVTNVELTRDAKQATIFISILAVTQTTTDPELIEHTLKSLVHAKGYLRKQISKSLQLRYVPDLIFKEDKGLENTLRVNEILKQLANEPKATPASEPDSGPATKE